MILSGMKVYTSFEVGNPVSHLQRDHWEKIESHIVSGHEKIMLHGVSQSGIIIPLRLRLVIP